MNYCNYNEQWFIQTSFPRVQWCWHFNPICNGSAEIAEAQIDPNKDSNRIHEK